MFFEVSLQIVMEFPGNCVVSSFNPDTEPELMLSESDAQPLCRYTLPLVLCRTQPSRPSDASRAVEWNLRRGQKGLSIGAKSEHQSDGLCWELLYIALERLPAPWLVVSQFRTLSNRAM